MTRLTGTVGLCVLLAGGLSLVALAEPVATTRPQAAGSGRGTPGTMPAGERSAPEGHGRPGGGGNWSGGGMGRNYDAPWPGAIFGSGYRGAAKDQTLTPQEKEELLSFLKANFPDVHGRLQRFQQQDTDKYTDAMRRLTGPLRKMMHLSRTNPRLADIVISEHKVEMKIADLRASFNASGDESERERIRGKIHGLVEKRFDLRQERLTMEIEGMRKRLDEAKARLAQQAANRAQLIAAETRRVISRGESEEADKPARHRGDEATHAAPAQTPPGAKQR